MNAVRLHKLALLLIAAVAVLGLGRVFAQSDEPPEYSRKGADSCLACHTDDVTLAVFRSPHGMPGDNDGPFGHGQLQCEACHGPGGDHAGRVRRGQERPAILDFGRDAGFPADTQNAQCLNCHADAPGAAWHNDDHAAGDVACADCHRSHTARDPVQADSTQAEICFDCHRSERAAALRPFAHPFVEGRMDCTSCHAVHGRSVASNLVHETANATCEQCHAEKRGPFLWEHAPVSENCANCHDPHGSNHPGMLVRRGPLLCQGCHSEAGHPSVAPDPAGLATDGLSAGMPSRLLLGQNCLNCHTQVHGSNHPSGSRLMR